MSTTTCPPKLCGVIVPAAVPVTAVGEPDVVAYRHLLDYLIDARVNALFVNGSMGNFATWTDRWQLRLAEAACLHVKGRLPLLAGISDTGITRVLEKIDTFSRFPFAAFVLTPPYYYFVDQSELTRFYVMAADASPVPIVLYDNPRLCKNSISPATIRELARHPNILGLKASAGDVSQWQEILRSDLDRSRFSLISGAGRLTSLALRLGFDGITEGLHNIVPQLAVALYEASVDGNHQGADALQERMNRCFRVFDCAGGWRGLAAALRYLGIADSGVPPPYDRPLTAGESAEIVSVLEAEQSVVRYVSHM